MNDKQLLNILKKLVALKTVSSNTDEQKKALDLIHSSLPNQYSAKHITKNGSPSTLFTLPHKKNIDIILNAHIDVLPAEDAQFKVVKKAGKLYARGVFDMKGPLIAMLQAVHVYYRVSQKLHIALLITSDEEVGGAHGTGYFLSNYNGNPICAIVPDGGTGYEIVTEEKGTLFIELTYHGFSAHSARPWEGINAGEELMRILQSVTRKYKSIGSSVWKTTATVTQFATESHAFNALPHTARAVLNVRNIYKDQQSEIIRHFKKQKNLTVKVITQGDALRVQQNNDPIRMFKKSVTSVTGTEPKLAKYPSSCDARFFSAKGIIPIISRPPGGNAHSSKEWVSEKGLLNFAAIIHDFFLRIEKGKE